MQRALIIWIMVCQIIWAIGAITEEVILTQDDGTTFRAHIRGDEYFTWIETKSGDILLYSNERKRYEYAKVVKDNKGERLVPSGIKYLPLASAAMGVAPYLSQPSKKKLYAIWKQRKEATPYHN